MLFNSYVFILLFLPVAVAGFFLIRQRQAHRVAWVWLVGCSLVYYGWWNPSYIALLVFSCLFNYALGGALSRRVGDRGGGRSLLAVAVVINLGLLGYYKYANMLADTVGWATGFAMDLPQVVLPLAISFFTFQQIAYLVDAYLGKARAYHFIDYCLFVTFFPQLIAGPIVHHQEMLPQFQRPRSGRFRLDDLSIGVTIFIIGLFKKVVIADTVAGYASPIFDAVNGGDVPTTAEAWIAALCYSFQIYFDFSGYSDMAIGAGRMFGIRLPLNFDSPYKASNVIDFWRRWHMTLSRFLRDYLYIPLGGNRKGKARRYFNLSITMLLGGLWHGASWTFMLWGGLHGLYLIINYAWLTIRKKSGAQGVEAADGAWVGRIVGRAATFLAVMLAWVVFRTESIEEAMSLYRAMFAYDGLDLGSSVSRMRSGLWIMSLLVVVWCCPNTQQIMARYKPAYGYSRYQSVAGRSPLGHRWLAWRPTPLWAIVIACVFIASLLCLTEVSEFIYFQF